MYNRAFGRLPDAEERSAIERYVQSNQGPEKEIWTGVAQVLFWSPEFIYVR